MATLGSFTISADGGRRSEHVTYANSEEVSWVEGGERDVALGTRGIRGRVEKHVYGG